MHRQTCIRFVVSLHLFHLHICEPRWVTLAEAVLAQRAALTGPNHLMRAAAAGRLVCRGWRAALDATVTSLAVGPRAREAPPHHWNRQQLMMQRLPALFPCLRSLDFNQARSGAPARRRACRSPPTPAARRPSSGPVSSSCVRCPTRHPCWQCLPCGGLQERWRQCHALFWGRLRKQPAAHVPSRRRACHGRASQLFSARRRPGRARGARGRRSGGPQS